MYQGSYSGAFNSTFIYLIPKKDKGEAFVDYRSISLCNCIYKMTAKVTANRIKGILSNGISQ